MQSFLTLDLAHRQYGERLAGVDQARATLVATTRPASRWPSVAHAARAGLSAAARLLLTTVPPGAGRRFARSSPTRECDGV
jgi:hypothetical protein